jgi:hypothetical protein
MIRAFFRFLGLVILAAGFIFFIYDGTKSIADHGLYITKLSQTWSDVHQSSLLALQPAVEAKAPWLWNPVIASVLEQPTWLIFAVLGAVLIVLGRKKRRLIGYARD